MTARAFLFAKFPDLPERGEACAESIDKSVTTEARGSADHADHALMVCVRTGDEREARAAFDTIYAGTYARLVRFAARMGVDADIAHDVVQDVFVTLWLNRTTWHAPAGSAPYLYTAVRHRMLKRMRHVDVVRRTDTTRLPGPAILATPDTDTESDEFDRALAAVLEELPERRRTAFLLRAVDDLSYEAIGVILGISGPAAYKQVTAAVQLLRTRLARFA